MLFSNYTLVWSQCFVLTFSYFSFQLVAKQHRIPAETDHLLLLSGILSSGRGLVPSYDVITTLTDFIHKPLCFLISFDTRSRWESISLILFVYFQSAQHSESKFKMNVYATYENVFERQQEDFVGTFYPAIQEQLYSSPDLFYPLFLETSY